MLSEILTVVGILGAICSRVDFSRRADHPEQVILRVLAPDMRQFIDETAVAKRVKDVANRSQPTDSNVRLGLAALNPHVRHIPGVIDKTQREFESGGLLCIV